MPWSGCPIARPRWPPRPPSARCQPGLGANDYVGDVADRTGFGGLEAVDEVTMVCGPRPDGAHHRAQLTSTVQAVSRP